MAQKSLNWNSVLLLFFVFFAHLASLTGVDPVVEPGGLVPTDPALHVDAGPAAVIFTQQQLLRQRGRRGLGHL